jgi:hypothetical protein
MPAKVMDGFHQISISIKKKMLKQLGTYKGPLLGSPVISQKKDRSPGRRNDGGAR